MPGKKTLTRLMTCKSWGRSLSLKFPRKCKKKVSLQVWNISLRNRSIWLGLNMGRIPQRAPLPLTILYGRVWKGGVFPAVVCYKRRSHRLKTEFAHVHYRANPPPPNGKKKIWVSVCRHFYTVQYIHTVLVYLFILVQNPWLLKKTFRLSRPPFLNRLGKPGDLPGFSRNWFGVRNKGCTIFRLMKEDIILLNS